jgi:hypothetical protein
MNVENLIPLADALPEQYAQNARDLLDRMGTVVEGIGDGDIEWRPSLLKVVQATTDRSALPKGTTIGDMVIGDEKIEQAYPIIPLRMWDSRQMWSPDKDDTRTLCWSPDAKTGITGVECRKCEYQVYDTVENKVACTKNKSVLAMSADFSNLFQINFSKSGYSLGMDFQGLLKKAGVAPFRRAYTLATESSKKAKNVEALVVSPVSLPDGIVAPELRPFLEALFEQISDDRKAHLDDFKIAAETRAKQAQLTAPAEESPQGLIEATPETVSTEQSSQAQRYSL